MCRMKVARCFVHRTPVVARSVMTYGVYVDTVGVQKIISATGRRFVVKCLVFQTYAGLEPSKFSTFEAPTCGQPQQAQRLSLLVAVATNMLTTKTSWTTDSSKNELHVSAHERWCSEEQSVVTRTMETSLPSNLLTTIYGEYLLRRVRR